MTQKRQPEYGSVLFLLVMIYAFCGTERLNGAGRVQFLDCADFKTFTRTINAQGELVLSSPRFTPTAGWDEAVFSWNIHPAKGVRVRIEARAYYGDASTSFYNLGYWSLEPGRSQWRRSEESAHDLDGRVATDTLILTRPADGAEVRLTFCNPEDEQKLNFLGASFLNTKSKSPPRRRQSAAWGITLNVPERSQMPYPDGHMLCSPAAVSMLLGYWSKKLTRPDLDRSVPEVARSVWDETWGGTGNWSFNMAYAGSFQGIRAYVTRMRDLFELESWIEAGIPVGLSVCYNKLRGKTGPPSGHLVVCCGFTAKGDPVINDPGTSQDVRKVFLREDLLNAWQNSHQTAYLLYPQEMHLPKEQGQL